MSDSLYDFYTIENIEYFISFIKTIDFLKIF